MISNEHCSKQRQSCRQMLTLIERMMMIFVHNISPLVFLLIIQKEGLRLSSRIPPHNTVSLILLLLIRQRQRCLPKEIVMIGVIIELWVASLKWLFFFWWWSITINGPEGAKSLNLSWYLSSLVSLLFQKRAFLKQLQCSFTFLPHIQTPVKSNTNTTTLLLLIN